MMTMIKTTLSCASTKQIKNKMLLKLHVDEQKNDTYLWMCC